MKAARIPAIIVDGDGTLWSGKVAAGIGYSYIMKDLLRGNVHNVLSELKGAK